MEGRLVKVALCSYVVGLCAVWCALRGAGDRWWVATVLLFIPRWWWGLPLGLLAPIVLLRHRRLRALTGLAALLWIGPMMGLCLPEPAYFRSPTGERSLRVLTCNADSRDLDPRRFRALLNELQPEIVFLQDVCKAHVPEVFAAQGWHVHVANGLCVASRFPIRAVEPIANDAFGAGLGWATCYTLHTQAGDLQCINLHLATPRWGLLALLRGGADAAKLRRNSLLRRNQSKAVNRRASSVAGPLLIVGDFNTPLESTVYRDCWSAFQNAFSQAGFGWGNTYLTRYMDVRIDHILISRDFNACRCWVGPDVGSAHRPLVADLARLDEANSFPQAARPRRHGERIER